MLPVESLIEKYGKTAIESALNKYSHEQLIEFQRNKPQVTDDKLTVVTGLWNLSKPGRSFDH